MAKSQTPNCFTPLDYHLIHRRVLERPCSNCCKMFNHFCNTVVVSLSVFACKSLSLVTWSLSWFSINTVCVIQTKKILLQSHYTLSTWARLGPRYYIFLATRLLPNLYLHHMGTVTFGQLEAFKAEVESFASYKERFELYIQANSVAADKKVSVFLSVIGLEAYTLLHNLCSPQKLQESPTMLWSNS